ncbi:hypothetical protein J4441_04215 [Candidatus Micrarchaeota archaeon]|nr:hypothetical protein [Candidatus Micrarchaeota archaeon]
MALDELLISTGVDALIRLVKEKKKIEVSAAAKALSLPAQTVEEWARVLEEEGIIAIKYQFTTVLLIWLNQEPSVISARTQKLSEQKKALVSQVSKMQRNLDASVSDLTSLEKDARFGGIGELEKRVSQLQARMEQLSALKADADGQLSSSSSSLEALEKKMSHLAGVLDSLEGKSASIQVPLPPKSKRQSIAQSASLLKNYASKIAQQQEQSQEAFASITKKISALSSKLEQDDAASLARSLRSDLELAMNAQKQLSNSMQEALLGQKALQEQISGIAAGIKRMESASLEFDATKFRSQLDAAQKSASAAAQKADAELGSTLNSINAQLAKIEAMQMQEKGIADAVRGMKKEYGELSGRVHDTSLQLRSAASTYEESVAPGIEEIERMRGKLSDLSLKKGEIEKMLQNVRTLRMQYDELSSKLLQLEKESEVLGILSDEPPPPALVEKINLTSEEEAEFDRKREELRMLIRKMWDEDKK